MIESGAQKPFPRVFTYLIVFTSIGLFCILFSFVTPLWLMRKPNSYNQFTYIGLWIACFDGYMRPDNFKTAYFGCWYIYHNVFNEIRDWLNPGWLYACQVLFTIAFVMQIFCMIVVGFQASRMFSIYHPKAMNYQLFCHLFSACCVLITVICFGQKSEDTRWMPYPHMNTLSAAFALAVIGLACIFVNIGLITYMRSTYQPEKEEVPRQNDIVIPAGYAYDPRAPPTAYLTQYTDKKSSEFSDTIA